MPDDNTTNDSLQNNDTSQNNNNNLAGKEIVLGCDTNTGNDANAINTVYNGLTQAGYKVNKLDIGPSPFSAYGYRGEAKGKIGIYLMAASLFSFADGTHDLYDYDIFVIRGDASALVTSQEAFETAIIPRDSDCNSVCNEFANMTYPQMNDKAKGKCVAVYGGKTGDEMLQAALQALGGQVGTGTGVTVSSGGGAKIKDKTFEKCIRRICSATDSIFIVENNTAILFPYTDWLAFTLRQKINTIKANEIDPNVFSIEYNNEGFYNKVSIAWGDTKLPERDFSSSTYKQQTKTKTTTKKGTTTQELSVDTDGNTILSEQYDILVKKYGVLEKRIESKVPDYETAQYLVNALLIQYIRDFNNSCQCRAISNRKYMGGTFYNVTNPFTFEEEMQYLNGYTTRTQKGLPLYFDLDFRYGPESPEEILDYQYLTGGAAASSTSSIQADGSATEQAIWADAAKIHYGHECSSSDPEEAYKTLQPNLGKISADCFGMSSYLYYRFNYQAGIPCRVYVGSGSGSSGTHRVVALYKNNTWYRPVQEYQQLENLFRYNSSCKTTNDIFLKEP